MLQMQQPPVLSLCPSLNSYSSVGFSEIASQIIEEGAFEDQNPSLDDAVAQLDQISLDPPREVAAEVDDDFEFAFAGRGADGSLISADQIFSNGQIRPIFPIFNGDQLFSNAVGGTSATDDGSKTEKRGASNRLSLRKLLIEDRDPPSSSSSEADELEEVPAGTYCVWKPRSGPEASPNRCKKSNSTGSSKRWRFRDFLHRSNSDGKETFVFLATEKKGEKPEISKESRHSSNGKFAGKVKGKDVPASEKDAASPHEMHYVRNRAMKDGDRRRSYLPYRWDLVGFFSNVNGLGRSLHPF